jgi:N-methylhydantoinase A/oxoprolinase/acetone carboxylase beta subunit
MSSSTGNPEILAIDAGGTMTDTIVIDKSGGFTVGKAQTTPSNEAEGFDNSITDALGYWETDPESAFPTLSAGIYSGTAMLNRLLEHEGDVGGIIVTAGQEDVLRTERARQTYTNYSYSDRLHSVTHRHNEPFIPRDLIYGVRERMDPLGREAIPLYEDEARQAVRDLLQKDIEYIVVNLIYSYVNDANERRIKEIAHEVMDETGTEVPLYLSSEVQPVRGDFMRLNTTIAEAYAAEPSREQLEGIQDTCQSSGAEFELRVMAGHGGTISYDSDQLASSLISGPIGGVIGGKFVADHLDIDNLVCTDIGGTSFDIALITNSAYTVEPEPTISRYLFNQPMVELESVGAGTGSHVKVDPNSNRLEIGPESAGDQIGVCYTKSDVARPTITDCTLLLGILNEDNFLGGNIELDEDAAKAAIEDEIGSELGIGPYEAAAGAVDLMESRLQNQVNSAVLGKGYSPVNYSLISYGGGGPVHTANYTSDLNFQKVLIPAWAAAFSAFGCACGDYEYRYDATIDLPINARLNDDEKVDVAQTLNDQWRALEEDAVAEFEKSGYTREDVTFEPRVRMQYQDQLNTLEVTAPTDEITEPEELDRLVENFEEHYTKVYARSAASPDLGYTVTRAVGVGRVPIEKPSIPKESLAEETPPGAASKGTRDVYWDDTWQETDIWAMNDLQAGNAVIGPAVIEAPATTITVPPTFTAELDRNRIFHLEQEA